MRVEHEETNAPIDKKALINALTYVPHQINKLSYTKGYPGAVGSWNGPHDRAWHVRSAFAGISR